ncbi:MAG: DUF2238 domain-containing protein [Planctomycetes bacterium]|nr:DUF2238 domain-containing protein [Planctomycetota bacterium]
MARVLFGISVLLFLVGGSEPYDRAVWVAENLPLVLIVGMISMFERRFRFSTLAWVFMAVLPALHTIGGHYAFALVPFDWVTETFGFERNHYDRMAHFTVGFFAFPMAELLLEYGFVRHRVIGYLFPLFAIMATAAGYEVFEWGYAIMGDPEAGAAVLGSQGDIWDAQQDILADTLGAHVALGVYAACRRVPHAER